MPRFSLCLACLIALGASGPVQAQDTDREILRALQAIRQELRALRADINALKRTDRSNSAAKRADEYRRRALEHHKKLEFHRKHAQRKHATPTRPGTARKTEHQAIIILEHDGERKTYHLPRDYHKIPAELRKHIPSLGKGGGQQQLWIERSHGNKKSVQRPSRLRVMKKRDGKGEQVERVIEIRKLVEDARKQAEGAKRQALRLRATPRAIHPAKGQPKVTARVVGNQVIVEIEIDGRKMRQVVPIQGHKSAHPRHKGHHRVLEPVPGKKGMFFAVPKQPSPKAAPKAPKHHYSYKMFKKAAPKKAAPEKSADMAEVIELLRKLKKELEREQRQPRGERQYF